MPHLDDLELISRVRSIDAEISTVLSAPMMIFPVPRKGVIVNLELSELEGFISEMSPKGNCLCVSESGRAVQNQVPWTDF